MGTLRAQGKLGRGVGTGQVWVEGGPEDEWGSTLGADGGRVTADGALTPGQTDPVRAASRGVAVVTGQGDHSCQEREELVAPERRGVETSGDVSALHKIPSRPPTMSRLHPQGSWSPTFPRPGHWRPDGQCRSSQQDVRYPLALLASG